MTTLVIYLGLSGALSFCSQPGEIRSIPPDTPGKDLKLLKAGMIDLSGDWSCRVVRLDYSGVVDGKTPDASVENMPVNIGWQVKDDSIWVFEYPCTLIRSFRFSINEDSLYEEGSRAPLAALAMEGKFLKVIFPGSRTAPVRTGYFERDTFNVATIKMLKEDSLNLECLSGKMKIITRVEPEDGEAYDIKFPVRLPEFIGMNNGNAGKLIRDKQISLSVKGQEKLFYLEKIEWNNYGGNYVKAVNSNWERKTVITLRPAEWWTGEPFTVSYEEE